MPVPDLSAYSDLTLYDVQPSDLVQRALLDAGLKLPDWQPSDGNTELVLMEALALIGAELAFAINRVPSATTMTMMGLLGIERSDGTPASATATFTLSDSLGHEVPAGTTVRLALGDDTFIDFITDVALDVAAGSTTGTVSISSTVNSSDPNGVTAGTSLELVSAVSFVDAVALGSNVAAGADPETDEDWRSRAIQRFAKLNETLVLPSHFTAEALAYAQVERATTIDNYDGTGANNGHVSVAVLGSNGALISAPDKATIQADLEAKAQANLAVHVIDPTMTAVDVTATVKALPGFGTAAVQAAVVNALQAYLDTDTWPWADTVRRYELIALMSQVEGVDYVASLTTPAADQALTGAAPLTTAGTLSVTAT